MTDTEDIDPGLLTFKYKGGTGFIRTDAIESVLPDAKAKTRGVIITRGEMEIPIEETSEVVGMRWSEQMLMERAWENLEEDDGQTWSEAAEDD